jgi:hypothetical protein
MFVLTDTQQRSVGEVAVSLVRDCSIRFHSEGIPAVRRGHNKDQGTSRRLESAPWALRARQAHSGTRLVPSPAVGLHHQGITFLTNDLPTCEIKGRGGNWTPASHSHLANTFTILCVTRSESHRSHKICILLQQLILAFAECSMFQGPFLPTTACDFMLGNVM